MIIETAQDLTKRVQSYNPMLNEDKLKSAFFLAERAHHGQVRSSGDPYFTHPVEVAQILADMHLDEATIITALLHDVVEDTNVSLDKIRREFGAEIARLVDGVTKLTRLEMQSDNKQAENFRKLLLAMSEDIRVLLVKLADRTHNMRTIDFIADQSKRRRIAQETLSIFAPLAERVGVSHFQHELEDRAFAVVDASMRNIIISRLEDVASKSGEMVSRICKELTDTLKQAGLDVTIEGRQKTPYSIWRKMQRQKVEMEELSDIMAFRVIVDDEAACYRALGIIHQKYPMVMGRFKDYISTPKRNRYRSLHTGVIGPMKKKIEIQIRSLEMHEVAENGVAAHWNYKDDSKKSRHEEISKMKWLNDLVNILEHAGSSDEFLEHTQMEMYTDQVFCFTPKGALINLPKGATAIDFAYAVHSDIGNQCVGTRINGRTRQLATILNNGDQVEIITDVKAKPQPEWENCTVTGKAKSAIGRFTRMEKQKEFSQLGEALVRKTFRQAKRKLEARHMPPCLTHFNLNSEEELFARVGENRIRPEEIYQIVFPEARRPKARKPGSRIRKPTLNIKGLIPGMAVHHGSCCHPLPGDRIVGIVTTGKGITVHRVDCQNLEKFSAMPELWLDIEWERDTPGSVAARLEVVLSNEHGSLASVATLISRFEGNITNIQLVNRSVDFFTFIFDVEVGSVRHLTAIVAAMRADAFVENVERAKT